MLSKRAFAFSLILAPTSVIVCHCSFPICCCSCNLLLQRTQTQLFVLSKATIVCFSYWLHVSLRGRVNVIECSVMYSSAHPYFISGQPRVNHEYCRTWSGHENDFRSGCRNVSQSTTTVLFRTILTRTITLNRLLIPLGSNHFHEYVCSQTSLGV